MKGLLADTLCPSRLFIFCGRRLVGRFSSCTRLLFQTEQKDVNGLVSVVSADAAPNSTSQKNNQSNSR